MGFTKCTVLLVTVLLIVSVLAPALGCSQAAPQAAAPETGAKPGLEVIALDSGKIKGTLTDGVWTYFGIPFAAPPAGDLRWREPQPVKPWEGIRDGSKFGLACPQPPSRLFTIGETGEDCLNLNVWSPAKSPQDKLPVMVWIHGGSFTSGAGSQKMYDAMKIAGQNVVVVTINYRVGPLGFFSHPLLSKESQHGVSGNYGLLDQIAALKWVQKNIKAMGGDPGQVTVFGESAGAACIIDLMICPLAGGLFQRAVSESGSFSDAYPLNRDDTVAKAEKTGLEIAAKLGCDKSENALACLRQKTADEVVAAAFADYDVNAGTRFRPVVDGWVLPDSPWALFSAGKQQKVPLLIGTNNDEGSIFVMPDAKVQKMSVPDYEEFIKTVFKDNAAAVLAAFPAATKDDVPVVLTNIRTVMAFTAGALHAVDTTAANSPVYMYRFTRIPNTPLKVFGAFHGLEIFYLFGNFKVDRVSIPENDLDLGLAQNVRKYWTNFAKTGDPNMEGLPNWPLYKSDTRRYVEFGDQISVKSDLYKEYRELMDRVTGK